MPKKKSMNGKLWEDEDFESCKMDNYCSEISNSLKESVAKANARIFRAWEENWEKEALGPNRNNLFQAKLVKKYSGLKWLDPDSDFSLRTVHPKIMYSEKKHGNNNHHVLACKNEYDFEKQPREQEEEYDVWERNEELFDLMVDYYQNNAKENVKCYIENGECESDDEMNG